MSRQRATLLTLFVIAGFIAFGLFRAIPSAWVTSLPQYHGLTRQEVVAKLRDPDHTDTFPMEAAAGEMRVPLYNTYPPSNPANADVMIEELWWKDGDYWITLWLHQVDGQWVVLDSCRWHKDVQF